jgi:hypothetical protein
MAMISPPRKEEPPPPQQPMSPFGNDDNPFEEEPEDEDYIIRERERAAYERQFLMLGPQAGKLSGAQVKTALVATGVATGVLRKVWTLSDIDKDGKLDLDEFAIALRYRHPSVRPLLAVVLLISANHSCVWSWRVHRLCEIAKKSPENPIPFEMLPASLVPPSKLSYFNNPQ